MNKIQQISSDARQSQTFTLDDGSQVYFEIEYKPTQLGWFIVELTYKAFTLRGFRIFTSGNMLRQFSNQIPFGIACYTKGSQEPLLIDDFDQGRSELYLMTKADVQQYEAYLSG